MEVTIPPIITTTAIGCSISCPGLLPLITMGTRTRAVVNAVIRRDDNHSIVPQIYTFSIKGVFSRYFRMIALFRIFPLDFGKHDFW